jgi:hypothetical protein
LPVHFERGLPLNRLGGATQGQQEQQRAQQGQANGKETGHENSKEGGGCRWAEITGRWGKEKAAAERGGFFGEENLVLLWKESVFVMLNLIQHLPVEQPSRLVPFKRSDLGGEDAESSSA